MTKTRNLQDEPLHTPPTPKQFLAKLKEIYDAETTFGSARAARMALLEAGSDIIHDYLSRGCRIVFLYNRLKEAGYTGSRKELSDWLVERGLWSKRKSPVNGAEEPERTIQQGDSVAENKQIEGKQGPGIVHGKINNITTHHPEK